jgi:ATP-dependent RNA helicase DDX60
MEEKKNSSKKVIQQNKERKAQIKIKESLAEWKRIVEDKRNMSPNEQVMDIYDYLGKLEGTSKLFLETEVRAYVFVLLIHQWQNAIASAEHEHAVSYAVKIWDQMKVLRTLPSPMTKTCHTLLLNLCSKLGLPSLPQLGPICDDRTLSFSVNLESVKPRSLSGRLNFHDFQLVHCGPYMDPYTNSKPDSRVEFEPDEWQRKVLDELDAKRSVFVVAPTSAGKTLISFYAMEQILREDDEGVLVYVAPTKTLVNQIAAEIQGRFSKSYQKKGQSMWAVHTRDTRIHDPKKCQILVTVPHIADSESIISFHCDQF